MQEKKNTVVLTAPLVRRHMALVVTASLALGACGIGAEPQLRFVDRVSAGGDKTSTDFRYRSDGRLEVVEKREETEGVVVDEVWTFTYVDKGVLDGTQLTEIRYEGEVDQDSFADVVFRVTRENGRLVSVENVDDDALTTYAFVDGNLSETRTVADTATTTTTFGYSALRDIASIAVEVDPARGDRTVNTVDIEYDAEENIGRLVGDGAGDDAAAFEIELEYVERQITERRTTLNTVEITEHFSYGADGQLAAIEQEGQVDGGDVFDVGEISLGYNDADIVAVDPTPGSLLLFPFLFNLQGESSESVRGTLELLNVPTW